jgi:predicted CXXCH cytochrome family protein
MAKYGISDAVVREYKEDVHGKAVLENGSRAAPACNDCHGNHGAAVPLGAGSVNETCGVCHVHNLNLFNQTRMNRVLSTRDRHGCATCHGSHSIQPPTETMLGITEDTICAQCHKPDDRGGQEAQQIRTVMDSLTVMLERATEMMQYAETKGYKVDQLALELLQGQDAMNMARTRVHSFSASAVRLAAVPAFDQFAQITEKVKGYRDRDRSNRYLYGVPFLLSFVILGIVALLYFMLDKKRKRQDSTR